MHTYEHGDAQQDEQHHVLQCLRLVFVPPQEASRPVPGLRLHRVLCRRNVVAVDEVGAILPVLGVAAVPSSTGAASVTATAGWPLVRSIVSRPAHNVLDRHRSFLWTGDAAGSCGCPRPIGWTGGREGVLLVVRVQKARRLARRRSTSASCLAPPVPLTDDQAEDRDSKCHHLLFHFNADMT